DSRVRPTNNLPPYDPTAVDFRGARPPFGARPKRPPVPGARVVMIAGEHAGRVGVVLDAEEQLRQMDAVMLPVGEIARRVRVLYTPPPGHLSVRLDGPGFPRPQHIPLTDLLVI